MSERETQEWVAAKVHLDTVRQRYTEIGGAGVPALRMVIDPLLIRYERGERTAELLDAIRGLE